MIKKIITGIIITAFLALGAAGSIYAYQREQPVGVPGNESTQQEVLPAAGFFWKESAAQFTENNGGESLLCAENKYQHNNKYQKNENNDNCEPQKNYYRWEYNYSHENENQGEESCQECNYSYQHNHSYQNLDAENKGNTSYNQNRSSNRNNK